MQTAEKFDVSTLAWIKGEIDETLAQARIALEEFADDQAADERLVAYIDAVHQVRGILQMVELEEAARFADEIEQLGCALQQGDAAAAEATFELLMRALLQLPDYLESLQAGGQDSLLPVLPLINELRAARGERPLGELALFHPNFDVPVPGFSPAQGTLGPILGKALPYCQSAIANLLREREIGSSLNMLSKVTQALLNAASVHELRQTFWIAGAVIEAVADEGLGLTKEIKQLFGKFEQLVRYVAHAGEAAVNTANVRALNRVLLFQVAHASSNGRAVSELKEAFDLDGLFGLGGLRNAGGLNAELKRTVASDIMEELSHINDTLDVFVRGNRDNLEALAPIAEGIQRLADTLAVIHQEQLQAALRAQLEVMQRVQSGTAEADDDVLMGIAGALLSVESTLKDWGSSTPVERADEPDDAGSYAPEAEAEHLRVVRQVMKEAKDDLVRIRECINDFLERGGDGVALGELPQRVHHVAGSLSMLGYNRAARVLRACWRFIDQHLVHAGEEPGAAQLDHLADAFMAIEYYLEAFVEGRVHPGAVLEVAENAVSALGYPVDGFSDQAAAVDAPDEPASVPSESPEQTAPPEEVTVEAGEPDAAPAGSATAMELDEAPAAVVDDALEEVQGSSAVQHAPEAQESAADEADDDDFDDEILEIFLEEANEELEKIRRLLPVWESDLGNGDALKEYRRSFHTLKGSGRLVGAESLGEFAWSIENMLNRFIDGSIEGSPALFVVLRRAEDAIPQLIEEFRTGQRPSIDFEAIGAAAHALSRGESISAEALSPSASDAAAATEEQETGAEEESPSAAPAPVINIDPELRDIYSKEAEEHLDTIETFVQEVNEGASRRPTEALVRALHTLKGSSRIAGVVDLATVNAALERYVKALQSDYQEVDHEGIAALVDDVALARGVLEHLADTSVALPNADELITRTESLYDSVRHLEAGASPEVGLAALSGAPEDTADEPPLDLSGSGQAMLGPEGPDGGWAADDLQPMGDDDSTGNHAPMPAEHDALPDEEPAAPFTSAGTEVTHEDFSAWLTDGELEAASPGGDATAADSDGSNSTGAGEPNGFPESLPEGDELTGLEPAASETSADDGGAVTLSEEVTDFSDWLLELGEESDAGAAGAEGETALEPPAPGDTADLGNWPLEMEAVPAADAPDSDASPNSAGDESGFVEDAAGSTQAADNETAWDGGELETLSPVDTEGFSEWSLTESDSLTGEPAVSEAAESEDDSSPSIQAAEQATGSREVAPAEAVATAGEASWSATDALPGFEAIEELPVDGVEETPTAAPALDEESAELIDLFLEEGGELLDASEAALQAWVERPNERDTVASLQRYLHTLKGSARLAGITEVGDLSHHLESTFEAIVEGRMQPSDALTGLVQLAHDRLVEMLDRVRHHQSLSGSDDLIAQLEAAGRAPAIAADAPETAAAGDGSGAPKPDAPSAEEAGVVADYDPELIDLFLEEGVELLDASEETLQSWVENPDDRALVQALQRQLHTLKGSARMAGVGAVGDLSHSLETAFEAIVEGRLTRSDQLLSLVQLAHDRLVQMLDRVREHRPLVSGDDLIARIHDIGRTPSAAATDESTSTVGPAGVAEPAEAKAIAEHPAEPASEPSAHAELAPKATFAAAGIGLVTDLAAALHAWQQMPGDAERHARVSAIVQNYEALARSEELRSPADVAAVTNIMLAEVHDGHVLVSDEFFGLMLLVHERMTVLAEQHVRGIALRGVQDLIDSIKELIARHGAGRERDDPNEQVRRHAPRIQHEMVRVRRDLLDSLVNFAGEVSIYRSRVEQQMTSFRSNLGELDETVDRLREQLRQFDIETEAQISSRYQETTQEAAEFDPLEFDRFTTMQQLSRAMMESLSDIRSIEDILNDLSRESETLLLQQARVNTELQENLMQTRMVQLVENAPRLRRVVRQTSAELERKANLSFTGAEVEMDRRVVERLMAPLEHMLRNSVAHGIEPPAERVSAGKPEAGSINIALSREGSEVVVRVSDDGRGIDVDAVRRKAVERGLMEAGSDLSDHEVTQFILESGFSTAATLSQVAGRGVGMDVVSSEIRQLGGALDIESERGKGTRFVIRLPLTLSVSRALLVTVGDEPFAIPLLSIKGIARIDEHELEHVLKADSPRYNWLGNDYDLLNLRSILGVAEGETGLEGGKRPLLFAQSGEHRVALVVDRIVGSREVVIKSLGPQLSTMASLSGATILSDGSVALILELPALIRRGIARRHVADEELVPVGQAERVPTVMIVDDSITVRAVTKRLLKRHNMNPVAAKDGVDALAVLEETIPDVMLLDIEMPRMDGFELATHIRNSDRLKQIPIIMITSRTGDKHRQRAMEIGVNVYMGKPYAEAELLENIERLVAEAE